MRARFEIWLRELQIDRAKARTDRRASRLTPARLAREGGAALLTVLVAVMIIFIMLFEFQYGAMVERQLAYNDLNQLQAYYLAKAGVRLGLLRISIYGRAQKALSQQSNPQLAAVKPFLEMIWSLPLPAFPPDAGTLAKMSKVDKDAAEKTISETKMSEGKSTHVITSESSKINLNFLQVPLAAQSQGKPPLAPPGTQPQGLFQYVGQTLVSLITNFIRDSDNPYEEYGNIKPEEIVYAIMDWVSPGNNSFLGGDKDSFYQSQNPPYKAKRNRLYTLDELRLVKGINEHLYNKLKPYVTVYSYEGRINLNTASTEMYKALYPDFTDYDIKRILEEKDRLGGNWPTVDSFVNFVTSTLGRAGFKTYYGDASNYPFGVTSESFLIEAMGSISRSKSQVQKIIRVSVALTPGKGGQPNPNITNQAQCSSTPGMFWDTRFPPGRCESKPLNENDCESVLAGSWRQQSPNQYCCMINMNGPIVPICPNPKDGAAGGINAMKILTWSES